MNTVTLHHGDCLTILKMMDDNSIDAICTDPPYALTSGQATVGFEHCLRWILLQIKLPDFNNTNPQERKRIHFTLVANEAALLGGIDSSGIDTGIDVPVGAVDFDDRGIHGEPEVNNERESSEMVAEPVLPLVGNSNLVEFSGDLVLDLRDDIPLTFCKGSCSCYRQLSAGRIGVMVVVPLATDGSSLLPANQPCSTTSIGHDVRFSDDTLRDPAGSGSIVTGTRTERTAVLTLDLHGRTLELLPADTTDECRFRLLLTSPQDIGTGTRTGGLPTPFEPLAVSKIDDSADGTNALNHVTLPSSVYAFLKRSIPQKGFMGKAWDNGNVAYSVDLWREALRVLKPGGYMMAFGGTRTYHHMTSAIEHAGFFVKDCVTWLYGSGFPKSHNVSAGIDRKLLHTGPRGHAIATAGTIQVSTGKPLPPGEHLPAYEAQSEQAQKYSGFGTALKPAGEPIVLAQKPLSEQTIVANVLKWGTGALNIDAARIGLQGGEKNPSIARYASTPQQGNNGWQHKNRGKNFDDATKSSMESGRWPANAVFSHSRFPVVKLKDHLPDATIEAIRRYFDGYTHLSAMRERGRYNTVENQSGSEVLQQELQVGSTTNEAISRENNDELPSVWAGVSGAESVGQGRAQAVLQSNVPKSESSRKDRDQSTTLWDKAQQPEPHQDVGNQTQEHAQQEEGESSTLEGWQADSRRICLDNDRPSSSGSAGVSEKDDEQGELRVGTSGRDGREDRQTTSENRDSSSHQRNQGRQRSRKPSDSGAVATFTTPSEHREGTGISEGREPALEILACDIPSGWHEYFELTGEDLGCRLIGTKRVENKSGIASGPTRGKWGTHETYGSASGNMGESAFYGGEDGTETVEAWECVDDCPVKILDEQSGERRSAGHYPTTYSYGGGYGGGIGHNIQGPLYADTGGASRFFYIAKPSRREKELGLESLLLQSNGIGDQRPSGQSGQRLDGRPERQTRNTHPTVKPVSLMNHLLAMIVPPNGVVLDLFMGSGTTGVAAVQRGVNFIGIEQDAESLEIARLRIAHAEEERPIETPSHVVAKPAKVKKRRPIDPNQYSLFGEDDA